MPAIPCSRPRAPRLCRVEFVRVLPASLSGILVMPRSTTSAAAVERKRSEPVPLGTLFIAFLKVSLYGVGGGGGLVWSRRIAVEQRRWITEQDFADIVSLCQFLPGPNIVGIAVCVGAKLRGAVGAIAATENSRVIVARARAPSSRLPASSSPQSAAMRARHRRSCKHAKLASGSLPIAVSGRSTGRRCE